MSEEGAAVFGAPTKPKATVSHLAPVPMFRPMLAAARDLVQGVNQFRAEIARADGLCTNMENICRELTESRIMPEASKHLEASVQRFRSQVTKVSEFCVRMEGVTADLQPPSTLDEVFEMPETFARQK